MNCVELNARYNSQHFNFANLVLPTTKINAYKNWRHKLKVLKIKLSYCSHQWLILGRCLLIILFKLTIMIKFKQTKIILLKLKITKINLPLMSSWMKNSNSRMSNNLLLSLTCMDGR